MTELLSILYKLRIFTSDELSEALKGKVKSVEALLARYSVQATRVDCGYTAQYLLHEGYCIWFTCLQQVAEIIEFLDEP